MGGHGGSVSAGEARWDLAAVQWVLLVPGLCELPHCCASFIMVRLMLVIGLGVLSPECSLSAPETEFSPDLLPGR